VITSCSTHYRLERNTIGFAIAIIVVASIGGFVEIAPLFTIDETVEDAPDMRVYTPLELAGRNIYIREGCYACHSQMIRTLRDEVERYGPTPRGGIPVRPTDAGDQRTGLTCAWAEGTRSLRVTHLTNPRSRSRIEHACLRAVARTA
jgi:cytochrome c oxidase cbb3-type subunit 2